MDLTHLLPRIPGAPPLPELTGGEVFFAVGRRHVSGHHDRAGVFGAYLNSVPASVLKRFILPSVGEEPPEHPDQGQLWWDSNDGQLYVWNGHAWVAASCCDCSAIDIGSDPPNEPNRGQLWWSREDGQLYIFTGRQWVAASCCTLPVIPCGTVLGNAGSTAGEPYPLSRTELTSLINLFTPDLSGAVPPPPPGTPPTDVLTAAGIWAAGGGAGAVASVFGRTGDIIAATGDYSFAQISGTVLASQLPLFTTTVNGAVVAAGASVPTSAVLRPNNTWSLLAATELAPIPGFTVLGDATSAPGAPQPLTQAQLTSLVQAFTQSLSGAVPPPGAAAPTDVLTAAGTWAAMGGTGLLFKGVIPNPPVTPGGQAGEMYLVQSTGTLWVWDGTQWVNTGVSPASSVLSFNTRTGAVVPQTGDYAFNQISGQATTAQVTGLAASATTDTTNATNIGSGTLAPARLPPIDDGTF